MCLGVSEVYKGQLVQPAHKVFKELKGIREQQELRVQQVQPGRTELLVLKEFIDLQFIGLYHMEPLGQQHQLAEVYQEVY